MTDVKIKCDRCKFVDVCVDYGWSECKKFTQKPSEPITNEEYLRSCNTEDLAIFLCNNLQEEVAGTLENRFFVELYHQYPINPMNAYHEVIKWLKEKYVDRSNCGEK